MVKLETDIDYIKRDTSHVKTKLDKFIDSADEKYASKECERLVYSNRKSIEGINIKLAYYAGAIVVLGIIAQLIIKHFVR